jgi:hypothetical protein
MRKALNDNPIAQLAIVGVLLVVAGLIVSGGFLKKKESSSTPADVAAGTAATPGAAAPAPTTAATAPAAGAAPTAGTTPTSASGLPTVEGPPLPRALRSAYHEGKVVVLLAVRGGGVDDRLLRGATARLSSVPGIAFFRTKAQGIARYTQITQGAGITRVPVLVVLRPNDLSGGTPSAEVRYGFRTAGSVVQAVRDALYRGPTLSYAPK